MKGLITFCFLIRVKFDVFDATLQDLFIAKPSRQTWNLSKPLRNGQELGSMA